MSIKHLLHLLLTFITYIAFGQKKNEGFQIHVERTSAAISVDGVLNESAWTKAQTTSDFYMVTPVDTGLASVKTIVKLTYDNQNLYISAVCYNKFKGKNIVESLRRDFTFNKNDHFLISIDTFDDLTNGFTFGVNAAGAQWDGQVYEGSKVNANWDNKWQSATKSDDEKWVFEAAIPFKTMRYKAGIGRWGINFTRYDIKAGEKSSWAPVPRQFDPVTLAFTGVLLWDTPPPTPKNNISVIPYALSGVSKDFQAETNTSFRKDLGGDVKVAVTSSMNLDLTINPDFSQVDADRQITNLNRFKLFYPEKRQFFLENGDLFDNFGFDGLRPFFSRQIGLSLNPNTWLYEPVRIQYGLRLSGKPDKDWRLGLMNIQTESNSEASLPTQNFSIFSLQRKVFSRSNISLQLINKESFGLDEKLHPNSSKFNRNLALEYNLASKNNNWTGKVLYMKSFSPKDSSDSFVQAANVTYQNTNWYLSWQHEYVGKNYNAEVGFIQRTGYYKINPFAGYYFYPKNPHSKIANRAVSINSVFYWNKQNLTDNETTLSYAVTYKNRSAFLISGANSFIKLQAPYDPTNQGIPNITLPAGFDSRWTYGLVNYISTPQKMLTYSLLGRYGGYYANGNLLTISGELGYRFQPYMSFSVTYEYDHIRNIQIPDKNSMDGSIKTTSGVELWLITPKLDFTFTNKLFFTTFIQYNKQLSNLNINARLQWRYKPASDLFLVYTDNYFSDNLLAKNRAVVLKFTYWWNL